MRIKLPMDEFYYVGIFEGWSCLNMIATVNHFEEAKRIPNWVQIAVI